MVLYLYILNVGNNFANKLTGITDHSRALTWMNFVTCDFSLQTN